MIDNSKSRDSIKNIKRRLIAGEDFTLFGEVYRFGKDQHNDGIYRYVVLDKRGWRIGAAKFTDLKIMLAFSFGRFSISLKDFITAPDEHKSRKTSTWDPSDRPIPLQLQRPAHNQ